MIFHHYNIIIIRVIEYSGTQHMLLRTEKSKITCLKGVHMVRFFSDYDCIFLSHRTGCMEVSVSVQTVRLQQYFVGNDPFEWDVYPFFAIAIFSVLSKSLSQSRRVNYEWSLCCEVTIYVVKINACIWYQKSMFTTCQKVSKWY